MTPVVMSVPFGSAFRTALAFACVFSGTACTTVSAPVISPVPVRSKVVAPTFSVAVARATATIQRPDGTTQTIVGNGEDSLGRAYGVGDGAVAMLVPALLSFHVAGPAGDYGWFLGWRQVGASGRLRLIETSRGALFSIAGAAKVAWGFKAGDLSGAFDVMSPERGGWRGIARLGLGVGRREYDVLVPDDLSFHGDNLAPVGHLEVFRSDLRVEALVGLAAAGGRLTLSMQPFWVLVRGGVAEARCEACVPGVTLLDFSLDRGIAFAITIR